jgi:hypothetical protein
MSQKKIHPTVTEEEKKNTDTKEQEAEKTDEEKKDLDFSYLREVKKKKAQKFRQTGQSEGE